MKNKTIKDLAPYIAILAAAGAAIAAAVVAYSKTTKALNDLEELDLDFGNDNVLSYIFDKKVNNEE